MRLSKKYGGLQFFAASFRLEIYSNDGSKLLGSVGTDSTYFYVTETGISGGDAMGPDWIYNGTKTFLGASTVKNATVPEYETNSTIPYTVKTVYIVEGGDHQ